MIGTNPELEQRLKEYTKNNTYEEISSKMTKEESSELLKQMRLLNEDPKRYGWQYLEYVEQLKKKGYKMLPFEDHYLAVAAIHRIKYN